MVKLLRSKRAAGIAPSFLDFLAYLVLGIVILIVIILFTLQARSQYTEIREAAFENENQQLLINLLKTKVGIGSMVPAGYVCCSKSVLDTHSVTDAVAYSNEYNWFEDKCSDGWRLVSKKKVCKDVSLPQGMMTEESLDMLSLISLWYYDKSTYELKLKIELSKLLDAHFNAAVKWKLEIKKEEYKNYGVDFRKKKLFETTIWAPLPKNPSTRRNPDVNITLTVYVDKVVPESRCYIPSTKIFKRRRCAIDEGGNDINQLCECKLIGIKGLFWTDCIKCDEDKGCDEVNDRCR